MTEPLSMALAALLGYGTLIALFVWISSPRWR
jgi:hypothetical protein